MKLGKVKTQDLEALAEDWGIDYQVFKIKSELVDTIKSYCQEHSISQRKLASMVPGLTQDLNLPQFNGHSTNGTMSQNGVS